MGEVCGADLGICCVEASASDFHSTSPVEANEDATAHAIGCVDEGSDFGDEDCRYGALVMGCGVVAKGCVFLMDFDVLMGCVALIRCGALTDCATTAGIAAAATS